jgi:hypothetical protein
MWARAAAPVRQRHRPRRDSRPRLSGREVDFKIPQLRSFAPPDSRERLSPRGLCRVQIAQDDTENQASPVGSKRYPTQGSVMM